MKHARVLCALALVVCGDAAKFMGPARASLVGETLAHDKKAMPETKHNKTAGSGYNPGSPLYKKQEKEGGSDPAPPPKKAEPLKDATDKAAEAVKAVPKPAPVEVPKPDHWYDHVKVGPRETPEAFVRHGLSYFLSYFIIVMLIALIWTKCTKPGRTKFGYSDRPNDSGKFAYSLFSTDHCFDIHCKLLLCSWCCSPLRIADTWAKEPLPLMKNFWVALILIACLIGLSQLSLGFTSLVFLGLAVYFRQQMRQKYGMTNNGQICFLDCLTWWCCPCCAIAQEARQVEYVKPGDDDGKASVASVPKTGQSMPPTGSYGTASFNR